MLSLEGRRCVITGANTGVGRATAVALAARGARVVLACRSAERAAGVLEELAGTGAASFVELDLASLASVRRAAATIGAEPVDVLVNNAGVAGARGLTKDGFELAFGVNFLGHYLLTRSLLPALAPGARVVHLSSGSHFRAGRLDLDAARRRTATLTGVAEYATSKLCVMLFHHELARRLAGAGVLSIAADPGDVASDAWRHVPWPVRGWITRGMKPPSEGARTSVFCATDPSVVSGGFYVDARPSEPSALSRDEALAKELWVRSAAWAGASP